MGSKQAFTTESNPWGSEIGFHDGRGDHAVTFSCVQSEEHTTCHARIEGQRKPRGRARWLMSIWPARCEAEKRLALMTNTTTANRRTNTEHPAKRGLVDKSVYRASECLHGHEPRSTQTP